MKVLVLDGHSSAAYAVLRSLSKRGFSCYIGEEKGLSLCSFSRYKKGLFSYPSPLESISGFLDFIRRESPKFDLVIPVTERTTLALSRYKSELDRTKIMVDDFSKIIFLMDKFFLKERLSRYELNYPETALLDKDFLQESKFFNFPLILKARFSKKIEEEADRVVEELFLGQIEDKQELVKIIERYKIPLEGSFIVQEKIEGKTVGLSTVFLEDKASVWFSHLRLREERVLGGRSALAESIEFKEKDFLERVNSFLAGIKYKGPLMIELKFTSKGLIIIDINPRFWGSVLLSLQAGLDFPSQWVNYFLNRKKEGSKDYKKGLKMRYLPADFNLFLEREKTAKTFFKKCREFIRFISYFFHKNRYFNFFWDDLFVFIYENLSYILKRVKNYFKRK